MSILFKFENLITCTKQNNMKKFLLPAALMLTLFSCAPKQQKTALPVYLDDTKPVEARVEDALSRMTLEEKVAVLHAQSKFSRRAETRNS